MIYDLFYRQNPRFFMLMNDPLGRGFSSQRTSYGPKGYDIRNHAIKWHNVYSGNGSPRQKSTNMATSSKNKRSVIPRKTIMKGIKPRKYSSLFR